MKIAPMITPMKTVLIICLLAFTLLTPACTLSGKAVSPAIPAGEEDSPSKMSTCYDSDKGMEFAIKGHTFGEEGNTKFDHWDSCISPNTVKEWYCQRTTVRYMTFNCQYLYTACRDGACINATNTTT